MQWESKNTEASEEKKKTSLRKDSDFPEAISIGPLLHFYAVSREALRMLYG